MARCFSEALGLGFRRVQFTPDLLPADLTGISVYDQRSSSFDFRPGPVFTQLLLADEINRTPPKTQAALLEAMAEEQVSSDGETRPLPAAVRGDGHRQPDRVRGHLRAARGTARPLPAAGVAWATSAPTTSRSCCARRLRHGWAPPKLSAVVDADDRARDARVARAGAGRAVGAALHRRAGARVPRAPAGHGRREPARRPGAGRAGARPGGARAAATTSRPRTSRRSPSRRWPTGSACGPSSGCAGSPPPTSSPTCSTRVEVPR